MSAFEITQIKSSYLSEVHDVNNAASFCCVHSALTLISRDCLDIKCQIVRCNQRLIGAIKYITILLHPWTDASEIDRDYLYAFLMFYYYVEIVSKLNQNISMKKRGLRRNLLSDIIFR